MTKQIFIDLDGVLADMKGGLLELFSGNKPADDIMWARIAEDKDYFFNLKPLEGAIKFFFDLEEFFHTPIVLTAAPQIAFLQAALAKKRWVYKHLGVDVNFIPIRGGLNKVQYIKKPGDVLIDDWKKNIYNWEKYGGIGILHEGDFKETFDKVIHNF